MKLLVLGFLTLAMVGSVNASGRVGPTTIKQLFAQSSESGANAMQVDTSIAECSNNRIYIDKVDKDLYAAVLAFYVTSKPINFYYESGSAPKLIAAHETLTCKLLSLY